MSEQNPNRNSPEDSRRLKMWAAVFATFAGIAAVWLVTLRVTLPGGAALGEEKKILDEAQKSFRDVRDDVLNRAEDLGEVLEKNHATGSESFNATTTNP